MILCITDSYFERVWLMWLTTTRLYLGKSGAGGYVGEFTGDDIDDDDVAFIPGMMTVAMQTDHRGRDLGFKVMYTAVGESLSCSILHQYSTSMDVNSGIIWQCAKIVKDCLWMSLINCSDAIDVDAVPSSRNSKNIFRS